MKIISKQIVKPAEETWRGIMPLSVLDQIAEVTSSSHIYFYNKPIQEKWVNPSNNKIIDTLKESLSRVLVPFYPLAGRLSWVGGGRLKLECNGMGAEFIEVESSEKIADLGDLYSCSEKFRYLQPHLDYYKKPIQELPVLAVQVTRFACGGLSVGICMSHVVVDGKSAFYFTEEWARLARGEPLEKQPLLDRRVLQAENVDDECTTKAQVLQGQNLSIFSQLCVNEKGDNTNYNKVDTYKNVTPTLLFLTKDEIERLKKVATNKKIIENGNNKRPYSRFEVISSHVWRCVTKARELDDEDITTLVVSVDTRPRLDPPLPSREETSKVNNEYVMDYIKFFKNQESLTKYQFMDDLGKVECLSILDNDQTVGVVSWLNLGGFGIDFGWGKEFHMGPPLVYASDGDVLITQKDDGTVVVRVCVQSNLKFQEYISIM
uniref:Uncharacterized protein n=1 Tax=Chenopodium quinoa TaxID=63459 RepID=A0A803LC77_CHEQI